MSHYQRELYPDIEDLTLQELQNNPVLLAQGTERQYRYVPACDRSYRKPPLHFSIEITRCDGNPHLKTLHPGSIFEGFVSISVESALAAQHIKLIFRAAERIHSDAISQASKKKDERLFAIRTILWGKSDTDQRQSKWPVLEAGEHRFPFMCELPMVNYPPTFRHHLASCEFELIGSIERPGIRPFQTVPLALRYEPYIVSESLKVPEPFLGKKTISNQTKAMVTLPSGAYVNLLDSKAANIPIKLAVYDSSGSTQCVASHIDAYIERTIHVKHGTYQKSDTSIISHADASTFKVLDQWHSKGNRFYHIKLPLPTELTIHKNHLASKNFSVLGMTTCLNFSKHIRLEYQLCITCKVKHSLISTKKQLFKIPLQVGTLSPGLQAPSSLVSYRDPQVTDDHSLLTKPKFLKPMHLDEQLPAYNEERSPPEYVV